jgi:hypothetical protein
MLVAFFSYFLNAELFLFYFSEVPRVLFPILAFSVIMKLLNALGPTG